MLATRGSANWKSLQIMVESVLKDMASTRVVARLWAKDHTLWKPEPTEIANRLGWLEVAGAHHRMPHMRPTNQVSR